MNNLEKDLTCPLTLDLFEDPISVPCCGKTFDRLALAQHFDANYQKKCPLCNAIISNFDPVTAPKNTTISGLVDSFKSFNVPSPALVQQKHQWECTMQNITNQSGEILPIAQMRLSLTDSKFNTKPSLFIAVVDRSGSMSGSPWRQVETALIHILTLNLSNTNIKTVVIGYESYAEIINTGNSQAEIVRVVKSMFTGGGTNFGNAFLKIKEVLASHSISDIGAVTVAFLTDGQAGGKTSDLISDFKNILSESWDGVITVHSIGFSSGCDKDLLEGLRQAGTIEGTFRYAEPGDDGDALCNKLTGLFEHVSKSATVSIKLKSDNILFKNGTNYLSEIEIQFPIENNRNGIHHLWIQPTGTDCCVNLTSDLDNLIIPVVVTKDERKEKKLFNQWIIVLIDELASDLLELAKNKYSHNIFDLYCSLLEQRAEAITPCIDPTDIASSQRMEYINSQLTSLRSGSNINLGKLGDLRFGSHYIIAKNNQAPIPPKPKTKTSNNITWRTECHVRYNRTSYQGRNKLSYVIINNHRDEITDDIYANLHHDPTQCDDDGNNALMLAAYCGQSKTVSLLLEEFSGIDLNQTNNDGETAVTLAIKGRGYDKTLKILLDHGAIIPEDRVKSLERYAINNNYTRTARVISEHGDTSTTINEDMTSEYIMFTYHKAISRNLEFDANNYLRIAVSKKMKDLVEILISKHNVKVTLEMLFDVCYRDNPDCFEITKLLLSCSARRSQKFDINQSDDNGDTLLFRASERGSKEHLELFISMGAIVDYPNKMGNTPLWIACWKRYPCIIDTLLDAGADVNFTNLKGNVPMSCICQKGPKKIAEQLIARGANVNVINSNGDSLIHLCCRNGQHEVLETLLNYVEPEIVESIAHIDGFNPLLAATEANRPECIRVLKEYGVDLEFRTSNTNPILPGATSLHLAAYYNKIEALTALISIGANINSLDINNQTPIHIAIIQGNITIVKILRSNNADLSIKDLSGNTALVYCRNSQLKKVLTNPAADALIRLARGYFGEDEGLGCHLLKSKSGAVGCISREKAINVKNHEGTYPLLEAILNTNLNIATTLIKMGANPKELDMYGLDCYFWTHWIGNQKMKKLLPNIDDATKDKIAHTKKISSHNSNNAMILFISGKNKPANESSIIGQKMDSFINILSESGITDKFENNRASIISVFDQKEIKINDPGQTIQSTLVRAKIFAVGMIASKRTDLEPSHILSLYLFTANTVIPQLTNSLIIKGEIKLISGYIQTLYGALKSLPPYQGEAYIGTDHLMDRNNFRIGNTICWPVFMSSSSMWRTATENLQDFNKNGTVFIIQSKSGRFIGQYSQFPYDAEVVFLPDTKFKVVNWYMGDVIALGQTNIRNTAYRIKEENIEKIAASNQSLIIEIVEV